MTPPDLTLKPFLPGLNLDNFDCGDADLNDFIKHDAQYYEENKFAQTTIIENEKKIIGYFTLAADSIRLEESETTSLGQGIRHPKNFPAVKIARLGIIKNSQKNGAGTFVIRYVRGLTYELHKLGIGARFVTVDAYPKSVAFYAKAGFEPNEVYNKDKRRPTASMRLDIFK